MKYKKKRLGEMLVEEGVITQDQLMQAISDQKKSNLKIGQFLIQSGLVTETQVVDIISKQLKIPKYIPESYPLDVDLSKVLPLDIAKKYGSVPIHKKGHLLIIAMLDPLDMRAVDMIEVSTNSEVEVMICTEIELNHLMSAIYGTYTDIGNFIDGIENGIGSQGDRLRYGNETDDSGLNIEEIEVSSLQGMAEEAPVVKMVNSILFQAVNDGVSDIHISPEKTYVQVRFRVDGKLVEVPSPPKSMFLPMVSRFKIISGLDIATSRIPQDGRFTVVIQGKEINVRVSTIPTIYGENIVLRLLDTTSRIYSLQELGMFKDDRNKLESIIEKPYGMILNTGPTGSGKSTTLFSMLKKLNKPDINIITLEDPVEYRMEKIRQVQLNRKAGMTFASGLRSILRQDPDVVMVGEIRDTETAQVSVQAALTGHRVLSTVHTNDSAGAITRFIDMGIEPFLIASVMIACIAQRLVRKVCENCAEPWTPPKPVLDYWGITNYVPKANFRKGKGCFQCKDTGYKGRIGLYEILLIDEMVQDMILRNNTSQEITRACVKAGKLRLLKEDAARKIVLGLTTPEEAIKSVML